MCQEAIFCKSVIYQMLQQRKVDADTICTKYGSLYDSTVTDLKRDELILRFRRYK